MKVYYNGGPEWQDGVTYNPPCGWNDGQTEYFGYWRDGEGGVRRGRYENTNVQNDEGAWIFEWSGWADSPRALKNMTVRKEGKDED